MEMGTIFWDTQNENGNYILGWREYFMTSIGDTTSTVKAQNNV